MMRPFWVGLLLASACGAALAQSDPADYPQRPIRLIVADSPGSADDFFARAVGERLEALYKQRVVIDTRPGAGGLIGNTLVSRAGADGHTLGMVSVTRLITALLREQPPYRALADVTGVAHVASITNVLVVAPYLQARTAHEFVRHARASPGDLNYASLGIGSASHLAGEVFSRALGIDAVHVPYRAVINTFAEMGLGRVHYAVLTLPTVLPAVQKGRLRPLAVMTPQRSGVLPEVPAIRELGLPDAQFDSWSGIVAPVGTPRRVVEQLHGDVVAALRHAPLRKRFLHQGAESTPDSTPDGFMRHMQEEYLRFEEMIRGSGIRPE
jgi:tripartite-type tricarboxylate transporter receptor subunit TctC